VCEWNRAARAHASFDSEHRYRHADGTVIWSRLHAAPILDAGNLLGYVTWWKTSLPSASQKRRCAAAANGSSSHSKVRAACCWTGTCRRAQFLSASNGDASSVGSPAQAVIKLEELRALVHPDDVEALDSALDQTLSGARPFLRIEYRIGTALGDWKWIETHARVVERAADGRALR
jgi:PAS domain-containing protein